MKYNMSWLDVVSRYALGMLLGIIGGFMHSIPVMVLAIPLFLSGLLGMCPLYALLGIDHATKSE